MNYTNFINALSRELNKEMKKELKRMGDEQETCFNFNTKKVQALFDRATTIVLTRTIDKQTKIGTVKGI